MLVAEILGVGILEKNEIAVDRNEYEYLKKAAINWKKHKRNLDGWHF